MALDRKIVVQRNDGGRNQFGEYVDNWVDVATVYATKLDDQMDRELAPEGLRTFFDRRFRVRWSATLAALDPSTTRIVEGTETLTVTEIGEWTDDGKLRRKFVDISVV